ncbi:LacI family transcriptional regulator [Reticulibacter mediterranei]|uniref:LacI family transcriptional regulator n=1 Tax=Reticulibacter mediterranei TaxID=2778369 RepID=A0A8J3IWL1_9CHLR|nr:GntR family transcriptional regulator [Reticulibacter mediterranei]GHO99199.1 LacI family transcriptional regulator [Reticulibacter mediterranei]
MQKSGNGSQSRVLHTQIFQELRDRILAGDLKAGDRLPAELKIAEQYNTSRGTVRQALTALVSEGLLQRVQGSGTFVSESAPAQRRSIPGVAPQATKSIGVILSDVSDELNMSILRGIEQATRPCGYQLSFAYAEENTQAMALDIMRLKANTDGLIIFPLSNVSHDEAIAQLQQESFPFVLVDRYLSDLDSDHVTSDNLGGGYRATEHLLILGHRRIGFAYGSVGNLLTTSVRDRWEGYRKALYEYHQPYDEKLVCNLTIDKKHDPSAMTFDEIMSSPDRPSAFFAVNGSIALELFHAAQRRGVRIPEDLALVGFDDLHYMALMSVPLTTVAQQGIEMGMHAGTLLINRIESQISGAPKHIKLPTNLIIRQSCGARLRIANESSVKVQPS